MVAVSVRADEPRRYGGYSVVQATVVSEAQLEQLTEIVESGIDDFSVRQVTCNEVECPGDLNGDGVIDLQDLAQLLGHYGTTSGATYEMGDLDGDQDVDLGDLAALLAVYGTTCS